MHRTCARLARYAVLCSLGIRVLLRERKKGILFADIYLTHPERNDRNRHCKDFVESVSTWEVRNGVSFIPEAIRKCHFYVQEP